VAVKARHHYEAGLAALRNEDFAAAEPEFQAAVALDPLMVLAHYALGQTDMALKHYSDAVRAYTGAQQAYRELATLQTADAAHFDEQLQRFQDNLRFTRDMTSSGPRTEALDEQIRRLETQKRRRSQTWEMPAELSLALGSAHYRAGDLDAAERQYLGAIKVRASYGEAHNNLAVVYMLKGRLREAEEEIARAEKEGFRVNPRLKQDLAARNRPQ
jgi:tetratricopeptide (TPR) repeat protein